MTKRIAIVVGTRPEAIKLAPLYLAARADARFEPVCIATGQHRELLAQGLAEFDLVPDRDLSIMKDNQSLGHVMSAALTGLGNVFKELRPDVVVAQGDTTTTFAAALAAFYERVAVAHVEAGLRTGNLASPFPEEANRRLVTQVTRFHFAPTDEARKNLLREGVAPDAIDVTGNTGIDALLWMAQKVGSAKGVATRRTVLVTMHRRENQGEGYNDVFAAIESLAATHPDIEFLFPVHPNPAIRATAHARFSAHPQVRLVEPLGYQDFVRAMSSATLILSDSGGIQEEAPSLKKPVLVLRDTTERPEAVAAGTAMLVGTNTAVIVREVTRLLASDSAREAMTVPVNPFGDGQASERILNRLAQ